MLPVLFPSLTQTFSYQLLRHTLPRLGIDIEQGTAAAAKTLRLSPPEALPLVIQAAGKPRFSRSSMAARAVLLSGAVTATPILFSAILSPLEDSPITWAIRNTRTIKFHLERVNY